LKNILMPNLFADLRYALRGLAAHPGFTVVIVLTLALGIGANSAIFALVDVTLLRPLPLPDADRVAMIWERSESSDREGASPLNLNDWKQRNRTFDSIAGYIPPVGGVVMTVDGIPEHVPRLSVTEGFFNVLGIRPLVGRTFLPDDDSADADVVVLSEGFWQQRFDADPSVVGRELLLDGDAYTVVGIVPEEAQLLGRTSIWRMVAIGKAPPPARAAHVIQAIGRRKPGVALEGAEADLAAVADQLAGEFPRTNTGRGVAMAPLHNGVIGAELRLTSMLFLGVVGFVLLICCANVASLLLVRATARTREIAIRSALGAGLGRIVRQLLTEGLVLAALGGVLALVVGDAILAVAPLLMPEGLLPGAVTPAFDLRVVVFCLATSLLVGVVFGLAPAWQATQWSSARVIAGNNRGATGRGGGIRGALVTGEVAIAVLLLVAAGLLLRTLIAVEGVDRGYRAENVLTMLVDPPGDEYPSEDAILRFYESVEREVTVLPGVDGVAWASTRPLGDSSLGSWAFEVVGDSLEGESLRPFADYQTVSPTYFETLDLPVVAGRAFSDRDRRDSVPVCIVNEAFVRRYLQGRSPIGQHVALYRSTLAGEEPVDVREIVGVARQVKGRPDEADDFVQIYVPMAQDTVGDIYLFLRPQAGRADGLATSVRSIIGRRGPLVGIRQVMTLDEVAREGSARHRFRAVLVVTFAALALVLAMVGVFGVLAYAVQLRERDFGVRRALGASTKQVLYLVFVNAARVVGSGVLIGLVLAALLGRLLAAMLFGVTPLDPLTFALAVIVLLVTGALSAAAPAWRATRVNPAVALRDE
jgi:putative ABC transport system permease protein